MGTCCFNNQKSTCEIVDNSFADDNKIIQQSSITLYLSNQIPDQLIEASTVHQNPFQINNDNEQLEKNAMEIQSQFDDSKAKREVFLLKLIYQQFEVENKKQQQNLPEIDDAKPISKEPALNNPNVKETLQRLGPYKYDPELDEQFSKNCLTLQPIQFNNEIIYIGQWCKGQKEGRGKQIWPDGSIYEGYWKENTVNGQGRKIKADGDAYEGSWKNNLAEGYGIYYHFNGSQYQGEWFDNQKHGYGTEIFYDNGKYEGYYQQGKIEGKGTYTWVDGRKYIGQWVNNKMEGDGSFFWPNGKEYLDEFKQFQKQEYDTFKWSDRISCKSFWKNGKQHGVGILEDCEGNQIKAEWIEGKLNKIYQTTVGAKE